jgi:hypothetical protein
MSVTRDNSVNKPTQTRYVTDCFDSVMLSGLLLLML